MKKTTNEFISEMNSNYSVEAVKRYNAEVKKEAEHNYIKSLSGKTLPLQIVEAWTNKFHFIEIVGESPETLVPTDKVARCDFNELINYNLNEINRISYQNAAVTLYNDIVNKAKYEIGESSTDVSYTTITRDLQSCINLLKQDCNIKAISYDSKFIYKSFGRSSAVKSNILSYAKVEKITIEIVKVLINKYSGLSYTIKTPKKIEF